MTQQRASRARVERTAVNAAVVSAKGARRWAQGHPWIYRSDVVARPDVPAGAVIVHDERGRELGCALWSPTSEIALRLLDRNPRASFAIVDSERMTAQFFRVEYDVRKTQSAILKAGLPVVLANRLKWGT